MKVGRIIQNNEEQRFLNSDLIKVSKWFLNCVIMGKYITSYFSSIHYYINGDNYTYSNLRMRIKSDNTRKRPIL